MSLDGRTRQLTGGGSAERVNVTHDERNQDGHPAAYRLVQGSKCLNPARSWPAARGVGSAASPHRAKLANDLATKMRHDYLGFSV